MKHIVTHFVSIGAYLLLVCVLLLPLPFHLSDGLVAAESGDPLLQVWVVQWNIHKLTTSLASYFDANIFYPYPNTFAFHDHLFGLGLLGLPLYALSHNPIFTYNILFLLSFVLSAYGMFLLVKELTNHSRAAWIAGVIFGFLPYRFAHLDHLNLLSIYWLPFCFLLVTRYFFVESRTTAKTFSTIALFYLCYVLQVLTSFNYLFFSTIALGIYGGILFLLRWKTRAALWSGYVRRDLAMFVGGALLVALVLLPFVRPYLKAHREIGFERSLSEIVDLSARLRDYSVAPENNLLYGKLTQRWQTTSPYIKEHALFNGVIPMLLAFFAIIGIRTNQKNTSLNLFRKAFVFVLLTALVLSFGPFFTIVGKTVSLPYSWLYHHLPGFKSMRVPARFGLLASLSLAVLAAIGFVLLERLFKQIVPIQRQTMASVLVFIAVSGLILLEYWSFPQAISLYPGNTTAIPEVYQWLAKQPEDIRIIELPVHSPKDNFEAMYYSTFHWKRLVNGRSAFIPAGITQIFHEMRQFPSQRTVAFLQRLGINYVLWHTQKGNDELPQQLPHGAYFAQQFGTDVVVELEALPSHNAMQADTPIFRSNYQIPLSLQVGEPHTAGLYIMLTAQHSFSPLPEDRAWFQIEWFQNNQMVYHETAGTSLPVFFEPGESVTIPLRFTAPSIEGTFNVIFQPQDKRFEPISVTKHITLFPHIVDSRKPEKLQAEFLEIDMPNMWKPGKTLPVRVLVRNTGNTLWKAWVPDRKYPLGEVRLGVVEWQNALTGEKLMQQRGLMLGARGLLSSDLAPGQETWIMTEIPTPDEAGEFLVEFDMVSEKVQWFSQQSSPTVTKKIRLQ